MPDDREKHLKRLYLTTLTRWMTEPVQRYAERWNPLTGIALREVLRRQEGEALRLMVSLADQDEDARSLVTSLLTDYVRAAKEGTQVPQDIGGTVHWLREEVLLPALGTEVLERNWQRWLYDDLRQVYWNLQVGTGVREPGLGG